MKAELRPASEMKESGVQWLGQIPNSWGTIRFKYVHVGANVGMSIDREYWSDDETDTAFYTAQIKPIHVRYNEFPEWKYTSGNDLLLARNATPYVYLPVLKAAYTDHIIRVDIKSNFDKRYIRYCLQQSIMSEVAEGVSLPTWSVPIWNRQIIPFISLEDQQTIADYLDDRCSKIDEIIAEATASIEEYKELKQAVIANAVLSGIDKNTTYRETGENWCKTIPSHWRFECGRYLFAETNARSTDGSEELLTVSQYTGITPRSMKNVTMFEATSLVDYKICEIGDIAANTMWMWAGAVGVSEYYGVISPSYNTYRQIKGDYDSKFLDYLLRAFPLVSEYESLSTGIRASRLRLYPSQFLSIRYPVPPMEEQKKIVDYLAHKVGDMDALISEKQSLIEDLQAYKKSLIYEVVTGKRRVV